jgi:hypothetical protein
MIPADLPPIRRNLRILVATVSLALTALVLLDLGRSVVSETHGPFGASALIPVAITAALLLPGSSLAIAILLHRNERWSVLLEALLFVITPGLTFVGASMYWDLAYG